MEPLFLKPVFQEKIWGGKRLHDYFGFDLPSDHIGEDWAISGHPHGMSLVENGSYQGWELQELWEKHPELFGNPDKKNFPLLIKILDAEADLSVQVHPDDHYALEHEGEYGKTECWYVIDAEEGAEIVYGHHAKDQAELTRWIEEGKWDKLLRRIPVKKGDFYYVPSGTIHAIGKGVLILETQQSSDTTYRVYDYDREQAGEKRELHLQQALAVTKVPWAEPTLRQNSEKVQNLTIKTLLNSEFFSVYHYKLAGKAAVEQEMPYALVTVISGSGDLVVENKKYALTAGNAFVLPHSITNFSIEGTMEWLVATE